jgi:RNA polymerase sigma-70 factor (ECF subfamily)
MEVHSAAMRNATEEPVASAGIRAVPDAPDATHAAAAAILPRLDAPPARSSRVRLVEQARAGDRVAFERLVEPWIEPAFRTALAILGREADARDATQDALLDAWRNIRSLRDPERFDAWLGRIHVNACRAVGRRRGRWSVREIAIDALPDPEGLPGRSVPVDEEWASIDELERAFGRLSIADRTTLVLHYLEHRSVVEVAARLGVAEGTVKWRLHEARNALVRAIEEERR